MYFGFSRPNIWLKSPGVGAGFHSQRIVDCESRHLKGRVQTTHDPESQACCSQMLLLTILVEGLRYSSIKTKSRQRVACRATRISLSSDTNRHQRKFILKQCFFFAKVTNFTRSSLKKSSLPGDVGCKVHQNLRKLGILGLQRPRDSCNGSGRLSWWSTLLRMSFEVESRGELQESSGRFASLVREKGGVGVFFLGQTSKCAY